MNSARLKLYYNYLGDFDLLDKTPQTFNYFLNIPEVQCLHIRSKLNKLNLSNGFVLEVFGNQRFLIKTSTNFFSKNLFFESTLRKENLFLFLDSCLNSIFLHDSKFLVLNNLRIEKKLYFYLNTELINHFNLLSKPLSYALEFSNLNKCLPKKWVGWSFYFIPRIK